MNRFGLMKSRARMVLAAVLTLEATGIVGIVAAERSGSGGKGGYRFFKRPAPHGRRYSWMYTLAAPPQTEKRRASSGGKRLAEPILRPPSLAANEAKLQPDEMVIGVEVGGKAQAYRFAAFELKSGHLVNDLVGGVPVSVAYCDKSECLRVYSDPGGSEPLDLRVAGILNDEMIVRHGGRMYFHKSGKEVEPREGSPTLPYALINPTVTTWKEWTARHPDTRVYIGDRAVVPKGKQRPLAGPE